MLFSYFPNFVAGRDSRRAKHNSYNISINNKHNSHITNIDTSHFVVNIYFDTKSLFI
jgi:hypothetical protein